MLHRAAPSALRTRHRRTPLSQVSFAAAPRMDTSRPRPVDPRPPAAMLSGCQSHWCRLHAIWVIVVLLWCASVSGAHAEPQQALLLYSYERDVGSHNVFAALFRPE